MNGKPQQEGKLIRNLQDAGCTQPLIEQFMECYKAKNTLEQTRILSEHRKMILHCVHTEQSKLDCLDFLLFQLKKSESDSH